MNKADEIRKLIASHKQYQNFLGGVIRDLEKDLITASWYDGQDKIVIDALPKDDDYLRHIRASGFAPPSPDLQPDKP